MNDNQTTPTSSYPLVVVIEDCYIPEIAGPLLQGLRNLDDESAQTTIKVWVVGIQVSTN